MRESSLLIDTIKRLLKQQGMTYRDVALSLKLSEATIKRMFASEIFTLDRLVQIANLLGYSFAELARESQTSQHHVSMLSELQEREIVADSSLLIIAVCVINHWTLQDILAHYRFSEAECIKYLLKLDALRIIDLLPGNRIRLNITRDFHWLPDGPIHSYFNHSGMQDFLQGDFRQQNESQTFIHGMFTEQAMLQAQEELKRLRQKFAELHETSLQAPMEQRSGAGMLIAFRKWEPEVFTRMKR